MGWRRAWAIGSWQPRQPSFTVSGGSAQGRPPTM